MPRRLGIFLVVALFCRSAPAGVLFEQDFDRESVATGPWMIVREEAQGQVTLSTDYPHSGHQSVELADVARDGDFTELQGHFDLRRTGTLSIRFAVMTATPEQELNIAFAGPGHFYLRDEGMGLWLKSSRGKLRQINAGRWKDLFDLLPFTWYVVAVEYDLDAGNYDLIVTEEGRRKPLVVLEDQPNAIGLPGAALSKFSFIGAEPWNDDSDVVFYVDDIFVADSTGDDAPPAVAPGRRMLFVDMYDRYRQRMYEKPACPPVVDHQDFGMSDAELGPPDSVAMQAFALWQAGCAAPRGCGEPCALELFREASRLVPMAKIYPMSELLALVAARRWDEADPLLLTIRGDWLSDPRFPALSAAIGIARGDLDLAERWLQATASEPPVEHDDPRIRRLWTGAVDAALVRELREAYPTAWSDYVATALVLEQRFYVLLWQRRFHEAQSYADRVVRRLRELRLPSLDWVARQADAAFYDGDYRTARKLYEALEQAAPDDATSLLKLSDVHFMLGNADRERSYRERIYGTLERKPNAASSDGSRACPVLPVDDAGDPLRYSGGLGGASIRTVCLAGGAPRRLAAQTRPALPRHRTP